MKNKFFFIVVLLLGLLFITPQQKIFAQQSDLSAGVSVAKEVFLPSDATSASAATTQNGFKYWNSNIGDDGTQTVLNPSITEMSGYDPMFFDSVSSFPVTTSGSSIAPGENFFGQELFPLDAVDENSVPASYNTAVNFNLGYDSTRTVSPVSIPEGGTHQTVTLTLKPIDALLGPDASYHIEMYSIVQGVTLISETDPTNLDQGEQISGGADPDLLWRWDLSGLQLNKQYTFTVVLNVPNQSGAPYEFRPVVRMDGNWQTFLQNAEGSTITITEPSLDGPVPSSGAITYAVGDANHTWSSARQDSHLVLYEGTQPPNVAPFPTNKDQCKKGGWKNFGMGPTGMFKNQGDCVSYVATHGKNPPN